MGPQKNKPIQLEAAVTEKKLAGLGEKISRAFEQGVFDLIFDLKKLKTIDTAGLALILKAHLMAAEKGGQIAFINGSREIQRIFETMGVNPETVFTDSK